MGKPQGLLEVPAKIVSFADNYHGATQAVDRAVSRPERFVGRWTSDSSAWVGRNMILSDEPIEDAGDVQLSIELDDSGMLTGEIVSETMRQGFFPYSRVMIEGEATAFGAHLEVLDIVHGERAAYAGFKLRVEGGREGTILMTRTGGSGIPKVTRLWRTFHEMGHGAIGEKRIELMMKSVPVGPDGRVRIDLLGRDAHDPSVSD